MPGGAMAEDSDVTQNSRLKTAVSQADLAQALVRIFGRDAVRQARENAASNAKAGDGVSEKMWLGVVEILERKNQSLGGFGLK